jgi:cytochrome c oxidase subunit 3
MLSGAI